MLRVMPQDEHEMPISTAQHEGRIHGICEPMRISPQITMTMISIANRKARQLNDNPAGLLIGILYLFL